MAKKKNKSRQRQRFKRAQAAGIPPIRGDSDNIYDDVDQYNMEYDDEILRLIGKPKRPIAKEVLRIASDDESGDNELEEGEPATHDEVYKTTNKWGKRSKNYYGTSYVDKDFGTINNSDEEEILQLEEEDSLARQRKMELANFHVDFNQFMKVTDANGLGGLADILQIQTKTKAERTKEAELVEGEEELLQEEEDEALDDEEDEEQSSNANCEGPEGKDTFRVRRGITYEIRKNKGIPKDKGRRKGKKHSRVMKRHQYKKALIKKRSQVPDVRRELDKYDGEKRGIRISTIRSIKL